MQERVGFIGLGIMGRPMAFNLIRGGHALHVYARRPAALAALTDAGAIACCSAKEVAENSTIIFTVVSDTSDVEALCLGENGIVEGAAPGTVLVDMSTVSPFAIRRIASQLAASGIHMLDAPVSGGEQGALAGTLSIMVGGDEAVFRRVLPLFELMGKNIVHVGGNGAGQVAKLCNQLLVAQTMVGVAEALLLARSAGVDAAKVRDALLGGFAYSKILEVHGRRMLESDYTPGFKAKLHQKDLRIVQESAHELKLGLPGAALAAQLMNVLAGEDAERDSSAVYEVLARLNGK